MLWKKFAKIALRPPGPHWPPVAGALFRYPPPPHTLLRHTYLTILLQISTHIN